MSRFHRFDIGIAGLAVLALGACVAPEPKDYSAFRAEMPYSILVLPPINQSLEVNAPYSYLSTVTRPLAEAGYYVFPVAVIDAFMKENGMSTADEMHAVPLDKLGEIFGPDAVLYVDIEDYGQKYQLVASTAVVDANASLVDVDTGMTLWKGRAYGSESPNNGDSGGIVGLLLTAAVAQAVGTTVDTAHDVAAKANINMIDNPSDGFLLGPYSRDHDKDLRGRTAGAPQ